MSHSRAYDSTVNHHSNEAENLYPKGNKKNISYYFILVRNGGLEVVKVYVWVEDRLGLILAHLESSCMQSTRLHISAMRLSSSPDSCYGTGTLAHQYF